jgi:predicted RNase H-like nuclease (RuvC/YqgF family)
MGTDRKEGAGMTPEEWLKESNKAIAEVIKTLHKHPELWIFFPEILKNREAVLTNSIKITSLENRVRMLQEQLHNLIEDFEELKDRIEDLEKEIEELKEGEKDE